jgi:hypothetical protein
MVLVPFAETKGTRLQGRNPAYNYSPTDPSMKSTFVKKNPNLDSRLKMSGMTVLSGSFPPFLSYRFQTPLEYPTLP